MPPIPNGTNAQRPWWTAAFVAVIVGALAHLGTLGGGIVRDDVPIVVNDARTADLRRLPEIWLTDWWYGQLAADRVTRDPLRDRLYRPLPLASIAMQRAMLGLQPFGFHLFNVLAHAAVCGLVNLFVLRLTQSHVSAGLAGLFFAVHPIHVEAVAEIVGRAELLAAAGLLAGLVLILPNAGLPSWRATIAAALAFLAALFSKETAVCYPALLLAVVWHRGRSAGSAAKVRDWLPRLILLCLPLAVYFPLRFVALEGRLFRAESVAALMNPLQAVAGWTRASGAAEVLGHYVRLLIWPARLSSDYSLAVCNPAAGFSIETGIGIATAIITICAAGFWLHQRIRTTQSASDRETAALLLILTAIAYALISNTFLLIGVSLAERLFYTPSIFAISALCVYAVEFGRRFLNARNINFRFALPATVIALMAVMSLRCIWRAADWKTSRSLLERDVATYPENARLSYQLATLVAADVPTLVGEERELALRRMGNLIDTTLRIVPEYPKAIRLSALKHELRGERRNAMAMYQRCLQLEPEDAVARGRLAELQAWVEQADARIAQAQVQFANSPKSPEFAAKFAEALFSGDRIADAIRVSETAAAELPESADVQRVLARIFLDRDPSRALTHASTAARLNPTDTLIRMIFAEALDRSGRFAEAEPEWRTVLSKLAPGDPRRPMIEARLESKKTESASPQP